MSDIHDRSFYDRDSAHYSAELAASLPATYRPYLSTTRREVERYCGSRTGLNTLELGAGSCTLSLALSDLPGLAQMVCMDISALRMQHISPLVAKALKGARPQKLEFREGSFNEPLPFSDGSIDIVLFDAALHHARSPWELLDECRRVLAPDGLLVAQREQYLAHWTGWYAVRRLLRSDEVLSGVTENAYLRIQYEYFLRARGFEPRFFAVAETATQRLLAPFNGLLYSKWTIAARRLV